MAFHVGQLVVCVKVGAWTGGYGDENVPAKGRVYTVQNIERIAPDTRLQLAEITNRPLHYSDGVYECWFSAEQFRPVDESRLAIFRQALQPVKEDA